MGYTLVNSINKESNVDIYPNPFSEFISIKIPDNEKLLSVKLLSNNGQMVYNTTNFKTGINKVNLPTNIPRGLYILVIGTDKSTTTKKVIHE